MPIHKNKAISKKSVSSAQKKRIPKANKSKTTTARLSTTGEVDVAKTVQDILTKLQAKGNDKVRSLNIRNGAGDNQFGVKLGDVRTLAKKIKPSHALALALWETGNLEAQLLSTLLIRAEDLSAVEMERLVKAVTVVQVAEWLHAYVLKDHPEKEMLRQKWMKTKHPMAARAGWRLTAGRITSNPEGLDVVALLDRIEAEMGRADPLIQWTMNMCLAEIGIHQPELRQRAIAIGEKLGIYRDFPCSPGCVSPFAPIWIQVMVKRQKR
ncbi:MAG TPA: DNA alkylation repair protein [Gemmatales bacterium]|nr:DNA alkylation repair protein [Gemmatales bacterium]